jgi:hypothetical protein
MMPGIIVFAVGTFWWKHIGHEPEDLRIPFGTVIFASMCLMMTGAVLMLIHLAHDQIRKMKDKSQEHPTST